MHNLGILLKNNFQNIELKDNILIVDCGTLNSKLYNFTKNNNIGGYEFLGTIPGTLGGAIRGNAGCYGSEIKDFLISVEAIDFNGNIISEYINWEEPYTPPKNTYFVIWYNK